MTTTGSHRKYARWLLNHAEEVRQTRERPRPRESGPEVEHALFLVWHAANRICAKRLIPFLPTLLEALERHEQLHISEECRKQLLSMSASLSRPPPAFATHTSSAWPFHHASGNATQAADSHSHVPGVEADPARLRGGGPGGPWRHHHRGRLPVHGSPSPMEQPGGQQGCPCCTGERCRCWLPSNKGGHCGVNPSCRTEGEVNFWPTRRRWPHTQQVDENRSSNGAASHYTPAQYTASNSPGHRQTSDPL